MVFERYRERKMGFLRDKREKAVIFERNRERTLGFLRDREKSRDFGDSAIRVSLSFCKTTSSSSSSFFEEGFFY